MCHLGNDLVHCRVDESGRPGWLSARCACDRATRTASGPPDERVGISHVAVRDVHAPTRGLPATSLGALRITSSWSRTRLERRSDHVGRIGKFKSYSAIYRTDRRAGIPARGRSGPGILVDVHFHRWSFGDNHLRRWVSDGQSLELPLLVTPQRACGDVGPHRIRYPTRVPPMIVKEPSKFTPIQRRHSQTVVESTDVRPAFLLQIPPVSAALIALRHVLARSSSVSRDPDYYSRLRD